MCQLDPGVLYNDLSMAQSSLDSAAEPALYNNTLHGDGLCTIVPSRTHGRWTGDLWGATNLYCDMALHDWAYRKSFEVVV
jgi:hypothetical protein